MSLLIQFLLQKNPFTSDDFDIKNSNLAIFNILKNTFLNNLSSTNVSRVRRSNGTPPQYSQKMFKSICHLIHSKMKKDKLLGQICVSLKMGAKSPIHKKIEKNR